MDPGPGPPAPPPDARIGRVLQDRYRILACLAEGAMGAVYRAERVTLGRPVAVKFLRAQLAHDPVLVKRFEVEARAMSRLGHPNCVSVIDFGVEGQPYLVMDFVQGPSLRALIKQGPLAPRRALRIARQILAALSHAHAQGIIHRDIKPENVLCEQAAGIDEHVRVVDFGLAKLMGSELKLTLGATVGTPEYMPPELTREGPIDERVDLYAAGIVLYEMLIGRTPFDAPDIGEIFARVLTMPAPRVRQVVPQAGLSVELEDALLTAMAKDPTDRFSTAAAMAAALDAAPEAGGGPPGVSRAATRVAAGSDRTVIDPLPAFLKHEGAQRTGRLAGARAVAQRLVVAATGLRRRAPPALRAAVGTVVARAADLRRRLRTVPRRTLVGSVAGAAVLASVLLAVAITGDDPPAAAPPAGPGAGAAPAAPAPASLAGKAAGADPAAVDPEAALKRLLELRRSEPRNAKHAAALARLYFDRQWWADGFAAFRAAADLDPGKRSDPVLMRHVVSSLQSEKVGNKVAAYLGDQRAAARPYLREAAKSHPSWRVRTRAAEILRSSGRRPVGRWFGRG